jgi:DNA-binding response OmpR family regulator
MEQEKMNPPPPAEAPLARILVAEDNGPTRAFLQALLRKAGYEVTPAANGQEAYDFLVKAVEDSGHEQQDEMLPPQAFDLLLCDSSMPVMTGRELVGKLRLHPCLRRMFIIMVTADAKVESVVSGLEVGADDYVTKPFQPAELLARVKSGLRIRRLQQEIATLEHQLAAVHLATAASHEINNPLMILMGNLEMLKRKLEPQGDEEINRRLGAIAVAAERIHKVALDLRRLKQVRLTTYVRNHKMIDLSADAPPPASAESTPAAEACTG